MKTSKELKKLTKKEIIKEYQKLMSSAAIVFKRLDNIEDNLDFYIDDTLQDIIKNNFCYYGKDYKLDESGRAVLLQSLGRFRHLLDSIYNDPDEDE